MSFSRILTSVRISCLLPALVILAVQLFPGASECKGRAARDALKRFEFHQVQMGTEFRLIFYAESVELAQEARKAAFSRLEELEQVLSDYRADSELTRVLPRAAQGPVVISADLFSVLAAAEDLALKTGGALDITVKPFVELWKIARLEGRLPSPQSMAEARQRVGYQKVLLNRRLQSVQFRVPGVKLDLGAIAKGYSADEMLKVLESLGIRRVLIDAGGDLRLGIAPPEQLGWKVRIRGEDRDYFLAECAAATSSADLQYTEIEGVRYSHIVDPATGIGLQRECNVTVLAPSGMLADGLATALSVLPAERGLRLVETFQGVSARIVNQVAGKKEILRSPNFPP